MLRNRNWRLERKTGRPVLNEVLSLNAQEFLHEPARPVGRFLNEVLSLNAQESGITSNDGSGEVSPQ